MDQPEKMKLTSMDVAEQKREELKQCLKHHFPEVFAEGRIDFDQLKRVLGEWVDAGKERFGLNWPGKAECMKIIQQPSIATLKPCREESVNFDETENLFIEGDNLEVLKLLQKSYFGKVKMIYIDPPYNTGKEFIYPDKYSETLETYLAYTGQVDDEGKKFSTNTETTGRFHSRWLNMMYPRLYLAWNLLKDDGAIFISIDENELSNLMSLCNMIFGEENFVECLVYEKKAAPKGVPPVRMVVGVHEYILCYGKKDFRFLGKPRSKEGFSNPDNDPRGIWRNTNCKSTVKNESEAFTITDPVTGRQFRDTWAHSKEEMQRLIEENIIIFPSKSDGQVRKKEFFSEFRNENIPIRSSLGLYDAQENTQLLSELFEGKFFQNPKHLRLMKDLISYVARDEEIILDFFAGSSTTAQAVLELNLSDQMNRKFVMVQLPERCAATSDAFKAGYKTIAEIGKDRIRRVIQRIEQKEKDGLALESKELDLGFRVFKLNRSNFKVWDGDLADADEETLKRQLEMHVEHVSEESSQEDVLYELLLKAGFPLTTKVRSIEMVGKQVFSIEGGAMLSCLEDELTPELIDAMAEADPLQVICMDRAFAGNDQLKANAVQTFKSLAVAKKSEIVFSTI